MHDQRPRPAPSHSLSTPGPNEPLNATRAVVLIAGWTDLSPRQRDDLTSDINSIVIMSGLPASSVLLTPPFLRQHVLNGSAAQHGASESRMRNRRSSLRKFLRRTGLMDPKDAPLSPEWAALLARLDRHRRSALAGPARFCSLRGVPSERMHIEAPAFLTHLTERTLTPKPRKVFGRMRLAWNRCCATVAGWPGQPIAPAGDAAAYIQRLGAFPASFQTDLAAFGDRLTATPLDRPDDEMAEASGNDDPRPRRRKVLTASSAALRQSHARWAASALVATGVPIEAVTSLASLVTPIDRAKAILRFLYERAGKKPSAAGMHVAEVLRIVAKYHVRLPEPEVARIHGWGATVRLVYEGMTEKNEATIRAAMLPFHETRLRALPAAYMQAARQMLAASPRQACSLALRATAIMLLTRRPLRLANLRGLRLDQHLQRDDPKRGRITHISVPLAETKNRRRISLPVAPDIADFLEDWIATFRDIIASPDCMYLFPGDGTGNKPIGAQGLRDAIKGATKHHVGVTLSPHQFRHLAARTYLEDHPGHYETVRQLLGNASLQVIVRHYSGIEDEASLRQFDAVSLNRHTRLKRKPPGKKPTRPARKPRPGKR